MASAVAPGSKRKRGGGDAQKAGEAQKAGDDTYLARSHVNSSAPATASPASSMSLSRLADSLLPAKRRQHTVGGFGEVGLLPMLEYESLGAREVSSGATAVANTATATTSIARASRMLPLLPPHEQGAQLANPAVPDVSTVEPTIDADGRFVCCFPGCEKTFTLRTNWRRHYLTHSQTKKFVCKECGWAFVRSDDYNAHARSHTGEKPFVCDFEGCNKRFARKSDLRYHQQYQRHMPPDLASVFSVRPSGGVPFLSDGSSASGAGHAAGTQHAQAAALASSYSPHSSSSPHNAGTHLRPTVGINVHASPLGSGAPSYSAPHTPVLLSAHDTAQQAQAHVAEPVSNMSQYVTAGDAERAVLWVSQHNAATNQQRGASGGGMSMDDAGRIGRLPSPLVNPGGVPTSGRSFSFSSAPPTAASLPPAPSASGHGAGAHGSFEATPLTAPASRGHPHSMTSVLTPQLVAMCACAQPDCPEHLALPESCSHCHTRHHTTMTSTSLPSPPATVQRYVSHPASMGMRHGGLMSSLSSSGIAHGSMLSFRAEPASGHEQVAALSPRAMHTLAPPTSSPATFSLPAHPQASSMVYATSFDVSRSAPAMMYLSGQNMNGRHAFLDGTPSSNGAAYMVPYHSSTGYRHLDRHQAGSNMSADTSAVFADAASRAAGGRQQQQQHADAPSSTILSYTPGGGPLQSPSQYTSVSAALPDPSLFNATSSMVSSATLIQQPPQVASSNAFNTDTLSERCLSSTDQASSDLTLTHRHHHHLDCGHVPVVHDGKMKWLLSDGRLEDEDMPEPMCLPESHLHPTACSGQLVCPSSGCAGDSHTPDALQPSTSAHAPSPAGDAFSMQSNALCDNASVSASKTVNAHAAAAAAPCGSLYHSHFPAGDGAHLRADSGPQAGGHHHHHGHQHFDGCGHPLVRHADHIDFLVDDRLHHVHDGHCDDHGQLTLLDDDTLSVLRTFTGLRSAAATE